MARSNPLVSLLCRIGLCACASVEGATVQPGQWWDGSAAIFESGQASTFNVQNVPTGVPANLAGLLTISVAGDFSSDNPGEYLNVFIDGLSFLNVRSEVSAGPNDATFNSWQQWFGIATADLADILADGAISVTLVNSGSVQAFNDIGNPFHAWKLEVVPTVVPAPAAAWLFVTSLGLLGFAARRNGGKGSGRPFGKGY